jgi:hypothetical protein
MQPSLDEFIAALPECPDCGDKLHRFAYCPGRRQIRPEAMQHPTQTEKEEHTMSATMTKNPRTGNGKTSPVTVKRTKPSAPGTIVDTSKAKPVGVVQEAAAKMAQERAATTAAIKAGHLTKKEQAAATKGKGSTKAKAAAKPSPKTGVPLARITDSWTGKGGKEVEVGSVVKAPGIASLTCVGRWTKRKGEQKIPFITGTTPDGTRKNVAAADCTIVKGPAAKK